MLMASSSFPFREEAGGKGRRNAKANGPASGAPDAAKAAPVLSAKARKRQAKIVRPPACQATSLIHVAPCLCKWQQLLVTWAQPRSAVENGAAKS